MTNYDVTGPVMGVLAALYLLPTFFAVFKRRRNVGVIFGLNLLLGWTIVGWIVAWMWAAGDRRAGLHLLGLGRTGARTCPSCARPLRKSARRCRACGYTLADG